jgi:hypothetical protein
VMSRALRSPLASTQLKKFHCIHLLSPAEDVSQITLL